MTPKESPMNADKKYPELPTSEEMAAFIRAADGAHQMGAAALAERLTEWLASRRSQAVTTPAGAVPEGYVLVPTNPTREMQDAWDSAPSSEDSDVDWGGAYAAMLAAAPRPAASGDAISDEQIDRHLPQDIDLATIYERAAYRKGFRRAILALRASQIAHDAPMSNKEEAAAIGINSALHRIRKGEAFKAIQPLEQALSMLRAPDAPAQVTGAAQAGSGQGAQEGGDSSKMVVLATRNALRVWSQASAQEVAEDLPALRGCLADTERLLLEHPALATTPASDNPSAPGDEAQVLADAEQWASPTYNERQREWCKRYERETGFDPLMDDFEAGNQTFVEAARASTRWYEDHSKDAYLRITDGAIPSSDFDEPDDALRAARKGQGDSHDQ